jgi:hypothetical protein
MAWNRYKAIRSNRKPSFHAGIVPLILLLCALPFAAGAQEKARPASTQNAARRASVLGKDQRALESEWIRATGEYKKSLEKMLALYRQEFQQAAARTVEMREFYERNLISRSDLEESQRALSGLEAKIKEVENKIMEADFAIGEATAQARGEGLTGDTGLIQYRGHAAWSPAGIAKIEKFFQDRFRRALPVSASGQTEIHDRMHLDHRNAVDVAVHPDSPEGQGLMTYLRGEGIPFVAFRSPVTGSATGAHIHIGRPSVRLSVVTR